MVSVSEIVSILKIADSLVIGEILQSKGLYSNLQSARVNAQKKLNELVALGRLERGNGYYRVAGCKSEYLEHSRLITRCLAELFKLPDVKPIIYREHVISEVGLRPDAVCLLIKDNQGYCFILEVLINEPDTYLQQKINTWKHWESAAGYLSKLFRYRIPSFDIAVYGEPVLDGTIPFQEVLK